MQMEVHRTCVLRVQPFLWLPQPSKPTRRHRKEAKPLETKPSITREAANVGLLWVGDNTVDGHNPAPLRFHGKHHSRVSEVVRNGLRSSTVGVSRATLWMLLHSLSLSLSPSLSFSGGKSKPVDWVHHFVKLLHYPSWPSCFWLHGPSNPPNHRS